MNISAGGSTSWRWRIDDVADGDLEGGAAGVSSSWNMLYSWAFVLTTGTLSGMPCSLLVGSG